MNQISFSTMCAVLHHSQMVAKTGISGYLHLTSVDYTNFTAVGGQLSATLEQVTDAMSRTASSGVPSTLSLSIDD